MRHDRADRISRTLARLTDMELRMFLVWLYVNNCFELTDFRQWWNTEGKEQP